MNRLTKSKGFTLIEIAIVLLVVTIMLGYTVAMFPIQQELKQYREVDNQIDEIIDNLIAFAQVNGRLPCPDTNNDVNPPVAGGTIDGFEDRDDAVINATGAAGQDGNDDSCKAFFGFLPNRTLGMTGKNNVNGSLIDPWGSAYGYAISEIDASGNGLIDLVNAGEIRAEGLNNVTPDLFICDDSNAIGDDDNCGDVSGIEVAGNVAAVVISLGKDFDLVVSSNIQRENFDDFHAGVDDRVYIMAPRSDVANAQFDDVVKWITPHRLYSKMIEADQLP